MPAPAAPKAKTTADVLAASKPSDWRALDPENTLYLDLAAGRVVIELAPSFAPLHAANIKTMAREHYFDALAILRVQDNFVTQWGDPNGDKPDKAHALGKASKTLAPEFERSIAKDLPFTVLPDGDVYAPEVGFSNGMPAARDPKSGKAWLAHCYGMVGAGRDVGVDTGPGSELYVVIGQAPRQLDRNIALVGRVVEGMQWLAALPRGTGPLGFYEKPEQQVSIKSVRLAADVPGRRTHESGSHAHGYRDVHRTRRIATQPPRRLVQGAGWKDRFVQRADPSARSAGGREKVNGQATRIHRRVPFCGSRLAVSSAAGVRPCRRIGNSSRSRIDRSAFSIRCITSSPHSIRPTR